MNRFYLMPALAVTLSLLSGCNAAEVKPDQQAAGQVTSDVAQAAAETVPTAEASSAQSAAYDSIESRLTLVQEQLIKLNAASSGLQQQAQLMLAQLKMPGNQGVELDSVAIEQLNGVAGQLQSVLDQMSMVANEMGQQTGPSPYKMVSAYDKNGKWILIRYDQSSGKCWIADQGQWMELKDEIELPSSEYQVIVLRADKDVKGYVAARLDKVSGDSWWLKKDTWQTF